MGQFSLSRLFASVSLIAIGLVLFVPAYRLVYSRPMLVSYWVAVPLWLLGGAIIGAGVLTPFKKPWLGAAIGLVVAFFGMFV